MGNSKKFHISGVLHVPPLPGAPSSDGPFQAVVDHVLQDAEALVLGGIGSAVLENFGDAPFRANRVRPHVPAMMAVLGTEIRSRFGSQLNLGINVLRNDGMAAIGVAVATGASFIRVNVFSGSAWTDQGLIEGEADRITRYRRELCISNPSPRIMADVCVKHAVPAGVHCIQTLASEAVSRGGADGLIVTGSGTGCSASLDDVQMVVDVARDRPVWVGSGASPESIASIVEVASGVIVGTYLHRDENIMAPIEKDRVRSFVDAARS